MTERLDAALAELADAIRDEVRAELADRIGGPPELLSIAAASKRMGIGRTATYDAIGRGQLRSIKVGRRRLIPSDALTELAQRGTAPNANGTAPGSNRDATATDHRRAV
jgi:excisionase family DNA binding protein